MVQRLPDDSHLARAVTSPEHVLWGSLDAQLAATTIEHLRVTNFLLGGLLVANGAKENPVPEPEPIYRPGVEKQEKKSKGLLSLASKMGAGRKPRIS